MEQLEIIRDVLGAVAIALGYLGAVLVLALVDAGFTLLLIRAARIFAESRPYHSPTFPFHSSPMTTAPSSLGEASENGNDKMSPNRPCIATGWHKR